MDHTQSVSLKGETLRLLPEKVVYWPARHTLSVADTHFGKAATFRHHGIPVPETTTDATLARLERAVAQTAARRLIVLGDFVHSNVRASQSFEQSLYDWRGKNAGLKIVLLRGNHDRGMAELFDKLDINVADSLVEEPFQFAHASESLDSPSLYGLVGHIHPQIELWEARKKLRLPCFWFGETHGVLPAFGDFTGCATAKPAVNDRVFVVADGRVIQLSTKSAT